MSSCLKIGAQFEVVVNLSVKHDPDVLFFIRKWLVTRLYVDDAQPAHRQADVVFDVITLVVGATMRNAAIHRRQ